MTEMKRCFTIQPCASLRRKHLWSNEKRTYAYTIVWVEKLFRRRWVKWLKRMTKMNLIGSSVVRLCVVLCCFVLYGIYRYKKETTGSVLNSYCCLCKSVHERIEWRDRIEKKRERWIMIGLNSIAGWKMYQNIWLMDVVGAWLEFNEQLLYE